VNSKKKVAIVDCGGANLSSLTFAIERLGLEYKVTNNKDDISNASHVVLPGVGAAKDAMQRLSQTDLTIAIKDLKQPILGICLGMQLLFDSTMEEDVNCLGIIQGECKRFAINPSYPVPHMGWNSIKINKKTPLVDNTIEDAYFYFIHSYYIPLLDQTISSTEYDIEFSSVIQQENFYGVQFHPEKSGAAGSKLLDSFFNL
jgi:glutamine amidotransferase